MPRVGRRETHGRRRHRAGALTIRTLALAAVCAAVAALIGAAGAGARPAGSLANVSAFAETAPKITKQPVAATVEEGSEASFEATASGTPAPTVQWEVSVDGGTVYTPIEGATETRLSIPSATTAESGHKFRAVFTNPLKKVTSAAALLTVRRLPAITQQPAPATVEEGQSAVFEAAASGFPAPTVQWELSSDGGTTWANAASGTSNRLVVASTKTTWDGRLYRATFKNTAGTAVSETVVLHVHKAPAVTKQPTAATVEAGASASFEATASGFPAPSVQWERSTDGGASWNAIEGASSTQLVLANVQTGENANQLRATFTNAAGAVVTTAVTLTVRESPAITQQPTSRSVEEGQSATFEIAASGFPAPSVQWETSVNGGSTWTVVTGATAPQLTIASAKTSESGHLFRASATNAAGKVTSAAATLSVHTIPAITKQPVSSTVAEGQNASFEASASGFPAPSVQWQLSSDGGSTWSAIEGATSAHLVLSAVTTALNGNEYRAVFTNLAGEARSNPATLSVITPPVITAQPQSTTVEVGQPASFEAQASGAPEPTVQWERSTNGGSSWSAIAGATSPTLSISATATGESGYEYRAAFTNSAGKATSAVATLTVATFHYTAFGWGQNLYRQLGDGTLNASENRPATAVGLHFVTGVAAGKRHSLALVASGSVYSWGNNEFGQLGNGTTATGSVPASVPGLSGVKAIAAGNNHSLALLSNGTVMSWGENEHGQLGNGTTKDSEVPVAVKGLTGVKAIAAGGDFGLALLGNGTVMSWGSNEEGQLGAGKTVESSLVPVAVKGLTGVSSISAGGSFAMALLTNGTVEGWGSDRNGVLDNASLLAEEASSTNVPVAVGTPSGVTAIATGEDHALALLSGGTVLAWGQDSSGELGTGTIESHHEAPAPVSGLSGVSAIAAGGHDSVALLGGGAVMSWGNDEWGTLGNGTTGSPSSVPVAVAGLSQVAGLSVGGAHVLAYGEPTPTVSAVTPKLGSHAGGTVVTITGSNLSGATSVHFGAVAATSFSVESNATLTATAPAGTGTVDITVASEAGTSPPVAADRFTYQLAPTVTKLSVKAGPVAGKTVVTITGTEFVSVSSVRFGALEASEYTVNSPTSITAVAPASAAGTVDVSVANTAGPSAATSKDHYKYTPTVTSLSPGTGPAAGGTAVTVTGTGFALGAATSFKFGTRKASAVNCTSSTSCTMLAPLGAPGTVNVIATVNKAASPVSSEATYTYS